MSFEENFINVMVDELSVLCWRAGAVYQAGCPAWHVEGTSRDQAVDRFKQDLHQKLSNMPFPEVTTYLARLKQSMDQG